MGEIILPRTLGGLPVHPMTAVCYEMLGEALTREDQQSGWLMLAYMDSLVDGLKPVWDLVLDSPERPGGWDLFNPQAAPGDTLPWLRWLMQFTGDYYDASVIGLDPSAPSPDQILRDKASNLRNWRRGSLDVIEEVVQERLPVGATVSIAENTHNRINHLTITVLAGGTIPDPLLAAVYQAIAASIPAGDSFNLIIVVGPSYADIEASIHPDSYAALQSQYPNYSSWPKTTQAPYTGTLPPWANPNAPITSWYDVRVSMKNWATISSYGSWAKIEAAGSNPPGA